MRLNFLIISLLILSKIYCQDTLLILKNHNVNQILNKFKTDKDLKNATIGFLAKDIRSGEIIAALNKDISMMPASTMKVLTTATAFEVLGKNYRYNTVLQYSGYIDTLKHILNGNIYIKGGGDPTLGSIHFDKTRRYEFIDNWVQAIKKLRIDSITGCIIADASKYTNEIACPKWAWEDVGNYYGSGANGLTVFDNLYELHLKSSNIPNVLTQITAIEPNIPGLTIHNEVLSSNLNSDEAFIFGAPYQYLHEVRGTIPKGESDFVIKGAIPEPAYFLAWKLNNILNDAKIKTSGKINSTRNLILIGDTINPKKNDIFITYSPSLTEIINITNKKSINLFAEHLLYEIGYVNNNSGSYNGGISAVYDFWKSKGMETDGLYIFDGSGLSRTDAVTPNHLVFILSYMKTKSKSFDAFYGTLPVAGVSGTLTSVGKNTSADGNIRAKSGSIGRVRTYAGYATTKSGRELAFCINIANYNCSSAEVRKKLEELMVALADFSL